MNPLVPPPFPARQIQQQTLQPSASPTPNCCSPSGGRVFNASVEQGATFSAQITLSIVNADGSKTPINITGNTFQYTAKPHQTDGSEIADDDPRTVKIDWMETNTPTLGQTWLIIPATTTENMQPVPYDHQLRMVSPGQVVTPLFNGSLAVLVPVSSRF